MLPPDPALRVTLTDDDVWGLAVGRGLFWTSEQCQAWFQRVDVEAARRAGAAVKVNPEEDDIGEQVAAALSHLNDQLDALGAWGNTPRYASAQAERLHGTVPRTGRPFSPRPRA